MMARTLARLTLLFAFPAVGVWVLSCTTTNDSTTGARTYQGAGSRWEITLSDTEFDLKRYPDIATTTANMEISGTVARNAENRMLTLTVSEATGTGAPAAGETVTALEIQGVGVFITPPGSSTPIVAVSSGTCPSADFNANWVITKPRLDGGEFPENIFDDNGVGTAVFTSGTDRFHVRSAGIEDGILEDISQGAEFLPVGMSTCTQGRLAVEMAGQEFQMYFTNSGRIVVKFPAAFGDEIIFGQPQAATAVTAGALEGTYSVLLYRGGADLDLSGATLEPARLTFAGGTGTLRLISDVADNTEAGSDLGTMGSLKVEDDDGTPTALPAGTARFTFGGGLDGKISCAVVTTSSPKSIACFGFTGSDPNRRPITILGHSR